MISDINITEKDQNNSRILRDVSNKENIPSTSYQTPRTHDPAKNSEPKKRPRSIGMIEDIEETTPVCISIIDSFIIVMKYRIYKYL